LKAEQLQDLTVHVMSKVEECGFSVDRLVTDCLSVNVKMFTLLNDGTLHPVVPYPIEKVADSFNFSPIVSELRFLSRPKKRKESIS
jgi:hypothetical protein